MLADEGRKQKWDGETGELDPSFLFKLCDKEHVLFFKLFIKTKFFKVFFLREEGRHRI